MPGRGVRTRVHGADVEVPAEHDQGERRFGAAEGYLGEPEGRQLGRGHRPHQHDLRRPADDLVGGAGVVDRVPADVRGRNADERMHLERLRGGGLRHAAVPEDASSERQGDGEREGQP